MNSTIEDQLNRISTDFPGFTWGTAHANYYFVYQNADPGAWMNLRDELIKRNLFLVSSSEQNDFYSGMVRLSI